MANKDYDMILNVGHGENTFPDTGSKGIAVDGKRQKKYAEHTFNAEVGKRVKKILDDHGVKYLLTQPFNGKDVPLSTRIAKANATNAKLYLSIHANAAGDKKAKGMCAFYHGYGSTAASNAKKAEKYAKYAKEEGLSLYHNGSWGSSKNQWNDFRETGETKMFGVITENGFMTNPEEFEMIFHNKNNYYDKVARVNAKFALDILGIKYKGDAKKEDKPAAKSGSDSDNKYSVAVNITGYKTADDAKKKKSKATTVTKGSYYIYKKSDGMINVSKKKSSPGSWINPADNKAPTTQYHTVKADETVWELSQKYKTTVDKIAKLNNLKDPGSIYPGQKLRVK